MSSAYEICHEQQRAITNTDEVELEAIHSGRSVSSAGIEDEIISGEMDDLQLENRDAERWEGQDNALDDESGAVLDVAKERKKILGDAYPFDIEGGALVYTPSVTGVYEYCLGICLAPSITRTPYVKLPRSFERLSAIILELYLGIGARSFHTGSPRYQVWGIDLREGYAHSKRSGVCGPRVALRSRARFQNKNPSLRRRGNRFRRLA